MALLLGRISLFDNSIANYFHLEFDSLFSLLFTETEGGEAPITVRSFPREDECNTSKNESARLSVLKGKVHLRVALLHL